MQIINYNPMLMIMLHLEPSAAIIGDFANWDLVEETMIKEAKRKNQKVSILNLRKKEELDNPFSENTIEKLGDKLNVSMMINYSFGINDDLKSFQYMLKLEKIYILKDHPILEKLKLIYEEKDIVLFENMNERPNALNAIEMQQSGQIDKYFDQYETYYKINGSVSQGQKEGNLIGYPTANIKIESKINLKHGVYFVRAKLPNDDSYHYGMSDLWINPVGELTFETHLFDFNKDIYGWRIQIELIEYIRENVKINSLEELKQLLIKDEKMIKDKVKKMIGE